MTGSVERKQYRASPKQKAIAKAMYLSGDRVIDIAKHLGMRDPETISAWAQKEGWSVERESVLQQTTQEKIRLMMDAQNKDILELQNIKKKAYESITKWKARIKPRLFSEASNAYISATELEYKLRIEALQINFLHEVSQILREEIQDQKLLYSIAERFRTLIDKFQRKPLVLPTGVQIPSDTPSNKDNSEEETQENAEE